MYPLMRESFLIQGFLIHVRYIQAYFSLAVTVCMALFLSLPVGGHDSAEDAAACMELMLWKVKEDGKTKRW